MRPAADRDAAAAALRDGLFCLFVLRQADMLCVAQCQDAGGGAARVKAASAMMDVVAKRILSARTSTPPALLRSGQTHAPARSRARARRALEAREQGEGVGAAEVVVDDSKPSLGGEGGGMKAEARQARESKALVMICGLGMDFGKFNVRRCVPKSKRTRWHSVQTHPISGLK